MAISNYTELKSAIADFLNRTDLTSVIPTFISLAESQMRRDVRHWKMEIRTDLTITGDTANLPSGFLEAKSVTYKSAADSTEKPLEYVSQATLEERKYNSEDLVATPEYFTVVSESATAKLKLFPTPPASDDDDISLRYIGAFATLGDAQASNFILEEAPDAYLYGSLIHSAPYLKDDERIAIFAQMYSAAINKLNTTSDQSEYKHGRLRARRLGLDTSRSKQPTHVRWT